MFLVLYFIATTRATKIPRWLVHVFWSMSLVCQTLGLGLSACLMIFRGGNDSLIFNDIRASHVEKEGDASRPICRAHIGFHGNDCFIPPINHTLRRTLRKGLPCDADILDDGFFR